MKDHQAMRDQLLALLRGGNAHLGFDNAIKSFPLAFINDRAPNVTYTPWHILEHMRITQLDILDFICISDHVSPDWPAGYWPAPDAIATTGQWETTIGQFRADLTALEELVIDPNVDLLAPIPHAPDYTIFREILLVADHNAYHVGEFAILRQVMETWPADKGVF